VQDAGPPKPLFVAFTLDVDPDANRAVPGRADAVGPNGEARLDACRRGLAVVREITAGLGLPVTLFWEGRTLREVARCRPDLAAAFSEDRGAEHGGHGFRHEDYQGAVSGRPMGRDEIEASLDAAEGVFADVLQRRPTGFRAPYCRMSRDLACALADRGYVYDASLTVRAPDESRLQPFRMPEAPSLLELPLCRARDAGGRTISGYVWQLCEGRREPADYVDVAAALREPCAGGLLQIALHPWHLMVNENGGPPSPAPGGDPAARFASLIEGLAALDGLEFVTLSDYLNARGGEAGAAESAESDLL
jgi:peptidoglycan/xylan/chitin deacetylase (PgdA/CDA1 family)